MRHKIILAIFVSHTIKSLTMIQKIYQTSATAQGGRDGNVKSEDGILDLEVRIPKSMKGQGGEYTNPEQLFAAGYAACFDSALNMVALQNKKRIKSETTVTIGLESSKEEGVNLVADIEVKIEDIDRALAQKLIEQAHEACPYSKATRNNIKVSIKLK